MQQQNFTNINKSCEYCGRPLPLNYIDSFCPSCKEHHLFSQVKDFIRENDVTEYDVAHHFDIPLQQVKDWIKEGRIEHKKTSNSNLISTNCKECGTPIAFGTLCTKCLKRLTTSGHTKLTREDAGRMRYFDE